MKPLEVNEWGYEGTYETLIESMNVEILVDEVERDYQDSSLLALKEVDRFGYLTFGWGSCSGCDSLQGCDTVAEVESLRTDLFNSIQWFETLSELKAWVRDHDFEGDWTDEELATSFQKKVEAL